MAYLLVFSIFSALTLASVALYRYGNVPRQNPIVSIAVLTTWTISGLIVFTIPLDITSTVYRQCLSKQATITNTTNIPTDICQKPWGMIPDAIFPTIWRIIYWSSQFLTWLIMPLMQSYLKAGDFTIKGKLKSALIDNVIYYGTYLFICGVLLIYLAFKPNVYLDWQKLKAIASSASNTWGLFLLVMLLGYALVEVPRNLWNFAKPGYALQYAYFKLAKMSSEKAEAEENVEDVLESLQSVSIIVPNHHNLRPCVETILRKVPTELMEKAKRNVRSEAGQSTAVPSEKSLVRLHKQVIKSLQVLQRTEALWSVQVEKVLYLEDVEKNLTAPPPFRTEFSDRNVYCHPLVQWYWECKCKSVFLKALACVTATLSFMVVWSELVFFNPHPVLSIFANVLTILHYDFATIEIFSMFTLFYLCYCAYSTIFRIKFFNLLYLSANHQTNEYSLIFSAMMVSRLTPPLCLNFLSLLHMDSHIIKQRIMETYYTQIMGHMDVLGIISDGFNIYFPMLMLAFCAATWFSVGSRLLNALGFQQFMVNETIASELVQEGKDLIVREKRKRQRAESSLARRREMAQVGSSSGVMGSGFSYKSNQTPNDGLLRVGSNNLDYNTGNTNDTMNRSLSQEINDRFGMSTNVGVDFRPNAENDLDNNRIRPKNIFDDV